MAITPSNLGPEITVKLMGRAAESLAATKCPGPERVAGVRVRLPATDAITPRQVLEHLAEQNPLLRDQILREDGTPRSSTRVLLNGEAPRSLDMKLAVEQRRVAERIIIVVVDTDGDRDIDIIIIIFLPCDG